MTPKPYDTTVAMIAGNIMAMARPELAYTTKDDRPAVRRAVHIARAVVAEVQRTEPEKASE